MPQEIKKQLLDVMLKVRAVEEKIVEVYESRQEMRTPTHLSIGQEAVAAALSAALQPQDQVFAGHRCHAAYLARGGDFQGFFDELCGRRTGVCHGRAGSAHLTDTSAGIYSSPILGAMIPVAVGAAMSFKMDKKPYVSAALFGDAAIEEGAFAESVNFAVTHKLPVLFVCENNLYSTHTPLSKRQPPSPIYKRMAQPDMPVAQVDGNDACLLYETFSQAVARVRDLQGPVFIECLTYRVREHVGPQFDYDRGYRTQQEVEGWMKRCPLALLSARLIDEKILTHSQVEAMKGNWKASSDAAYMAALKAPWPEESDLQTQVY
jgi:pyruvate dehydrogenase E1 component alpha subunit